MAAGVQQRKENRRNRSSSTLVKPKESSSSKPSNVVEYSCTYSYSPSVSSLKDVSVGAVEAGSQDNPSEKLISSSDGLHNQPISYAKAVSADTSSLTLDLTDISLNYYPPLRVGGKVRVKPPKEIFELGEKIWANTLVGYFLGKNPAFPIVQRIAKSVWAIEDFWTCLRMVVGIVFSNLWMRIFS